MEAIAKRAGLAVGTLYNYFPSKVEVLATIFRLDTDKALAAGKMIIAEPPMDPSMAIVSLLNVYVQPITMQDRPLRRELLGAALTNPDSLGAKLFGEDARLLEQLSLLVRELQTRGLLAQELDVGRSAMTLYSILLAWIMTFLVSENITTKMLIDEIRHGVNIVVKGLQVEQRQGETV